MMTFPELIKNIRDEAGLTQGQFAEIFGVSTVLISMIESGQKEVSKNFLLKLSDKLNVHPSSITPFLFIDEGNPMKASNSIERWMLDFGERMQKLLIKDRAKRLASYGTKK